MKRFVLGVVLALAGCGAEVPKPVALDLRSALPVVDAKHFDVLSAEQEIAPGKELMFCTDFVYDGEDTAFDLMETTQAKFGHHAVLFIPLKPNPPGTVTDCTDAASMKNYSMFALPRAELPTGHGSVLLKGKQLVIQSHYINTGKVPILVRDVVRIRKVPTAEVTSWDSVFINSTEKISIPPHAQGATTTFDCPIANDLHALILVGHMHEWGTKFEAKYVTAAGVEEPLYKVDQWKAEYRDSPPTELYWSNPKLLKAGGLFRITCTWNNTTDSMLTFPQEMCLLLGYTAGTKDAVVCGGASL